MLPEKFISRIRNQKYIDSGSLLKALDEPSPVSIRINTGKWDHKPQGSEQVPWCETGYYLKSRPSFTLDPLFHSGCYYPREASGMFLEEIFRQAVDIKNDIWALDLCGAPGGKSIQISDLIGPSGHLVSNEVIRSRAPVLAETITKWGCSNTLVTCNDPSSFSRMEGWFDVILVDAPCSGEGMFRNSIAVNEWSEENAVHCAIRQKRIISDVWPALKENGHFIYSTCTFNPGENEENIKWLIENNEAESLRIDISRFSGIAEIDFNGIYGYGFYPGRIRGEGFFVSAIRKKGTQQKTAIRSQKRNELIPSKKEISSISGWTAVSPERILKYKDEIFSIPCSPDEFMYIIKNLNVVKRGTAIASVKQEDFLPSHELALSKLVREDAFTAVDIDLSKALAYLRRDTMNFSEASDGWNLLKYKAVSIGFVKKIGNRVNNYFPTEWRIRMSIPPDVEENITAWENGK